MRDRALILIAIFSLALKADQIAQFEGLIKAGQYAEAAHGLNEYTAAHADSWQAFYQLGYAEFRLHHIQASLTALCRSIVLNRNASEPHKILAYDLNILGHQDMAVHELEEAIRCDASNAEAHYELGRISYEQGQYLKSAKELEQAKALKPDWVRTYHNLGLAYSALGETSKAVDNFEEGLRRNAAGKERSAWPLIDYATFFNMRGDFAKARDMLKEAIAIDDSFDREYSELGKAYRGLDEPEAAITALKRAIAINAQNAEYHYVLARLYTQVNRPQEAKWELAAYERFKK